MRKQVYVGRLPAEQVCRLVLSDVCIGWDFQEETRCTARPQVFWVCVCLCSQVLLLPLGVSPMPAPARFLRSFPQDREVWRVLTTTSYVGNVTQGHGVADPQVFHISGAQGLSFARGAGLGRSSPPDAGLWVGWRLLKKGLLSQSPHKWAV